MSNIVMQWMDSGNKTHKIDIETDESAESFLHAFRSFLYVCGFHEDTIHEMLNENEIGNPVGESL